MGKLVAAAFVTALSTSAPMQCTSEPDPQNAREETPGEALYRLAEEFRAAGDDAAWRQTLAHLIQQYPSSRYAVRAKADLESLGPADGGDPSARAATQR